MVISMKIQKFKGSIYSKEYGISLYNGYREKVIKLMWGVYTIRIVL